MLEAILWSLCLSVYFVCLFVSLQDLSMKKHGLRRSMARSVRTVNYLIDRRRSVSFKFFEAEKTVVLLEVLVN